MKERKLILLGILLVTSLACSFLTPETKVTVTTEARTYENENFSFTIPADWQTNEEIWAITITPGTSYLGLGVQEIISIQNPPYQRQVGGIFTVAASSLASGEDLELRFTQTYDYILPVINVPAKSFEHGLLSGFEISYQRPIGEPWWQFHDIWLEKDGMIYVLSFYTLKNGFENYAAIFDQILDSFQFKE